MRGLSVPRARVNEYSGVVRMFNRIGKAHISNEILYYRDDYTKKNFYDYSAGITYHKTEDLSFSIKGTNLLNKAKETTYGFQPLPGTTNDTLSISPIDKSIILSVEYTF